MFKAVKTVEETGTGPKRIMIVSGEASGDLHGASLMEALKALESTTEPAMEFRGMGGAKMRAAGLRGLDSSELSVVGVAEVLTKLGAIFKALGALKAELLNERFDCLVLIDFPDFNLRLAAVAKKAGIPVVYYISPQVWAWRKGRIKKIARLVDKMLVIFPFEETLYKEAGVDVEYVGHPLAKEAVCPLSKEEARVKLSLGAGDTVVTLLPGSRTDEVRRLLIPMTRGAAKVEETLGNRLTLVLAAAESIDKEMLDTLLAQAGVKIQLVRDDTYAALRAADAAIVASGTATLETALIGTPMVIVYKVSPVTYVIGRIMVDLVDYGLPNIVAGERVVPELLQSEATPENIAKELKGLLMDEDTRAKTARAFELIRERLGAKPPVNSAPERAARAIQRIIGPSEAEAGAGAETDGYAAGKTGKEPLGKSI